MAMMGEYISCFVTVSNDLSFSFFDEVSRTLRVEVSGPICVVLLLSSRSTTYLCLIKSAKMYPYRPSEAPA